MCLNCVADPAGTMATAGYAVFGMDYEGFGMSQGLHAYISDFSILVSDVLERALQIRGEAGGDTPHKLLY